MKGTHDMPGKAYDDIHYEVAGHTATITLNLDDIKPHVAITSPANNATVPDPQHVVISGTASDEQTAVASIQVNGNPATIATDGTWTITLDLSAAPSPIALKTVA